MEIQTKIFIRFINNPQSEDEEICVENRNPELIKLPEECEFYFCERYVATIDGVEYPFGPEMNVSKHYFKVAEHFVNPDHFRVYEMRCNGWSEEKIWRDPSTYKRAWAYAEYTLEHYPQGVVIVNQVITNPGADGIILSSKVTINDYIWPSADLED